MSTELTRGRFLKAAGAGAMWVALAHATGCDPARRSSSDSNNSPAAPDETQVRYTSPTQQGYVRTFRSRPDLTPPTVDVATSAHDTAPGYIFVTPKKGPGQDGPMILDNRGELVWFRPVRSWEEDKGTIDTQGIDFKVQRYRGEPVLTFWEGIGGGYGQGEYVILDGSYRDVTRVRAGNGYLGDHHEFLITERDTALITIYDPVPWDLSPVGGSTDGVVREGIVQEVDIATGEVLFEWHSLDHVGLEEAYYENADDQGFGYFHINAIDVDHDGNLLISARKTSTVYKVDRETGEILWRLGGKKSDFEMRPGTRIGHQHDARRQPDGTLTIFDNGVLNVAEQSRGLVLNLDEDAMTATMVREYTHPDGLLSNTQGNMQVLPNGNVFIGWGSEPLFSEFSSDGKLLFDAGFSNKRNESYRAFRFPWSGHPQDDPAVAAEPAPAGDELTVYASWNGATDVASWQVLAGATPNELKPIGSAPRSGFETAIAVRTAEPYVGVQARDRSGRGLGTARAIKLGG